MAMVVRHKQFVHVQIDWSAHASKAMAYQINVCTKSFGNIAETAGLYDFQSINAPIRSVSFMI